MNDLESLLAEVRACRVCEAHLPLDPRPVVTAADGARLLIVGQAPGTKVHETGIPWNDASGDRLREWMDVDRDTFYGSRGIAILPTGLCYPGRAKNGGDNPPRPECAPLWHPPLMAALPDIELTLVVGTYAQAFHLGERRHKTMTDTVKAWRDYLPDCLPTPHPSWRTTFWQKKNPWFEAEVVPELRRRVRDILG